jgi:hypothetical protein
VGAVWQAHIPLELSGSFPLLVCPYGVVLISVRTRFVYGAVWQPNVKFLIPFLFLSKKKKIK